MHTHSLLDGYHRNGSLAHILFTLFRIRCPLCGNVCACVKFYFSLHFLETFALFVVRSLANQHWLNYVDNLIRWVLILKSRVTIETGTPWVPSKRIFKPKKRSHFRKLHTGDETTRKWNRKKGSTKSIICIRSFRKWTSGFCCRIDQLKVKSPSFCRQMAMFFFSSFNHLPDGSLIGRKT